MRRYKKLAILWGLVGDDHPNSDIYRLIRKELEGGPEGLDVVHQKSNIGELHFDYKIGTTFHYVTVKPDFVHGLSIQIPSLDGKQMKCGVIIDIYNWLMEEVLGVVL